MHSLQAILFDLDGVLVNTRDYHFRAWVQVAKDEGVTLTRHEYEQTLRNMRKKEVLHYLAQGRSYSEEQFQSMIERRKRYFIEYINSMTEEDIVPGTRLLLGEARQAGIKTAIASAGKHARLILERLELRDCFDGIADRYSICNNKPAPDIFLFAAGLVNVPVSLCLAIDDKAANIAEAKRVGMHVLGIGEKEHFSPDDPILPSLTDRHLHHILSALECSNGEDEQSQSKDILKLGMGKRS